MATGDATDMLSRLKALLPKGWFPDSAPVRDALLSGFAWTLSLIYSLIQYAQLQTRIATATGGFLDLISYDFFGANLPRNQQEADAPFRTRIIATLFRPKATRPGMIAVLTAMTGRAPVIFEPARPLDTGAYGASICGYGAAGGYGSLLLRAQAFITVFRPSSSGIPFVAGYGSTSGGYNDGSRAKWASLIEVEGAVTDADLYATVNATKAGGTEMWVQLSN